MEEIKKYVEENKERFLNELFELIRIPSISSLSEHKPDMYRCAEQWTKIMLAAGADRAEVYETEGNPVAYGEKIIDPALPTVLVYGHMDVMPVDPIELWNTKPFEPVIKDGKIENGDTAVIDFEGFKDGVAFEGGKAENYPLEIGSNTFIPGFEEQLIGLKAGDEKDIKVTFPEDYAQEELKGQEAVFKIKVHEVKTKELPEMDEEFFKDLGYEGVETEEQLKDLVKADLEAKQEYEIENKYVDDLLEEAAKHTVVDLPEELVHEEIHRMMHQYEENLKMQGITLDMFYQFTNSTAEDLEKQMHPEAEKRVKYRFMLEEIATLEKIEVTDEEANKEAEDLAKKYNTTKDELLNQIGGLDALKYELEMQKVIEILKK